MITMTTGIPGHGMTLELASGPSIMAQLLSQYREAADLATSGGKTPFFVQCQLALRVRQLGANIISLAVSQCGTHRGELATREGVPHEVHPVGNTGTTFQPLPQWHGAAIPPLSGSNHG